MSAAPAFADRLATARQAVAATRRLLAGRPLPTGLADQLAAAARDAWLLWQQLDAAMRAADPAVGAPADRPRPSAD